MARALLSAFPEVHERQVRNEVVQQVEERKRATISRPTRRQRPKTRLEKAGQTAEDWYKKHADFFDDDMESF